MAVEEGSPWPTGQDTAIFVQQVKATGGLRGIGLLGSQVRMYERIRKPVMQEWDRDHWRGYDFATKGRSAEAGLGSKRSMQRLRQPLAK